MRRIEDCRIRVTSLKIDSYKKLIFWQRSRQVSLSVVKLTKQLSNERPAWIISDQIIRSCFSVGANIAEGFGKYRGKEYGRFLQMALGSARETEYWLELLSDIYPNLKPDIDNILLLNEETIKMLVATVRKLRN